jgi:hypothetical protein
MTKRFLTVLLLALILGPLTTLARPPAAGAAAPYASLRAKATVNSFAYTSTTFPFPADFTADQVIALYDTNSDGIINTFPASGDNVFPFVYIGPTIEHGPITLGGSRIGSPYTIGDTALDVEPFCGHVLVYAEQALPGYTAFVWFAFPDPNRPRPANCDQHQIDFGAGSYSGNYVYQASNVHHASFVGGWLNHSRYEAFGVRRGQPGSLNVPGMLLSADPDPSRPMPQPLPLFRAVEPGADIFLIDLTNVVIDVPFVAEEHWDGTTLFGTVLSTWDLA